MSEPDLASRFIADNSDLLHSILRTTVPLAARVIFIVGERDCVSWTAADVELDDPMFSDAHRPAVTLELARPRGDDELLLVDLTRPDLVAIRIDRARITRELAPPTFLDVRNHLPMPWPVEWHGPFALDIRDAYRVDTPDCMVVAQIVEFWDREHLDEEGSPRHEWRLELGITQAMDSALADDDQIEAITSRFRNCGAWQEVTHLYPRRHPSRRLFATEVACLPQGTVPWLEIKPLEPLLGPPPGWGPVGSFSDRPLAFRIEGTRLRVEWMPPPGADFFEAATGRLAEASRFLISAQGTKPTDEEVGTVFMMLGGAAFREVKGVRPVGNGAKKGGGRARVFLAHAGWLRKAAGKA